MGIFQISLGKGIECYFVYLKRAEANFVLVADTIYVMMQKRQIGIMLINILVNFVMHS